MSSPHPIIHRPVVTEKTMNAAQRRNTYCFEVDIAANKIEIRRAVEGMFKVKVLDVRTMIRKGKTKMRRRPTGRVPRTPDRKRAVVRLAEGQVIDLF
ncbi:MAG: 50S ribosomal protein L23 [Planctomycetaceae bacterium]|nr:50S ribosomal protein L23 [Planctomycetota bacterium]NUN51606.1 50S ribosomal protein L23 [Planctomycetaceae bacterium]